MAHFFLICCIKMWRRREDRLKTNTKPGFANDRKLGSAASEAFFVASRRSHLIESEKVCHFVSVRQATDPCGHALENPQLGSSLPSRGTSDGVFSRHKDILALDFVFCKCYSCRLVLYVSHQRRSVTYLCPVSKDPADEFTFTESQQNEEV
jgi:hypothetical protein